MKEFEFEMEIPLPVVFTVRADGDLLEHEIVGAHVRRPMSSNDIVKIVEGDSGLSISLDERVADELGL